MPKLEIPKLETLEEWLTYYKLDKYIDSFLIHGFDDIDYIGEDIIDEQDMITLGINEKDHPIIKGALKAKGYIKGI